MIKNTFLSLFLFVCLTLMHLSIFAQTNKTTLKGNVSNAQNGFIMLRQQGRADTVKLGKEGAFEVLIEQNNGNYFIIEHGKQSLSLYLLPVDVIEVKANATNLLDATVTGSSAAYCHFLIEKQKADKNAAAQFPGYRAGTIPGERYFAIRDSIRTSRNNALQASAKTNGFIDAFISYEKKSYDYQMGLELINYKNQASKMGNSIFPPQIDNYIASLDLSDEQVAHDAFYKSFALNRLAQLATALYHIGTDKSLLHFYELEIETICREVKSEKNKSILISEFMPQLINDVGTSDLRNIIATLEKCSSDTKLINSIKKYAAQFEYLYPGKPAPNAVFYDAAGKTSRISDYKGKVLYIDAWATWCGPCKREIPSLKALEEEYHGKNVQFISVSTDKDINAWKNFIAKEQMGGLQLHQSDKPEETISRLYVVNSIPRFILIDKDGNIVLTDAPRPSSGEAIHQLLDDLLAE